MHVGCLNLQHYGYEPPVTDASEVNKQYIINILLQGAMNCSQQTSI
jgi:hypothetical protein